VPGVVERERGGKWTGPYHQIGLSWPVFEGNEKVDLDRSLVPGIPKTISR